MKLSKREKILIVLVLIIGSAVAYIFLFYLPCTNETNELNSQIRSNQTIISTNDLLKKQIDQLVSGISEDEKLIAEFGAGIDSAFDQPAVLVYLYETMNKYGEKVAISFSESSNLGKVTASSISVTMSGTYEALKKMMKELAEGEYFIKVISLSASSDASSSTDKPDTSSESEKTNKQTTLNINMTLEFYNIGDEIPPDKTYPFTGGAVQYGGDIFH